MITYNFAAEYAALLIIITVLSSFSRNYDTPSIEFQFLKRTYVVALVSVLVTIAALLSGAPSDIPVHRAIGLISNILYFIVIPSGTLCYLLYTKLITTVKFDQNQSKKLLQPAFIVYGIYVAVFIVAMACGKVFSISPELGYVRHEWYQLPYLISAINLVWVIIIILRHLKSLHRDIINIMLSTVVMATAVLCAQYHHPNTIMTGILNVLSFLGLHLYAQNMRKSTDLLTGVYNRIALIHALEKKVEHRDSFSLYVFSFRGTKVLNARYGTEFGDKALMYIAKTFLAHAPEQHIFRYGGDEFALLLTPWQKNHGTIIRQLVAQLEAPLTIDDTQLTMELVYARVDYPTFGDTVQGIMSAADHSISTLKRHPRGGRYLYDPSIINTLLRRSDMMSTLKYALEHDRLEVHYQPIYAIKEGYFTQAEALVRLRDQDERLIYPNDFITLAVKSGLIVPMTYLILEHVCRDLRHLLDTYGPTMPLSAVSVNFPYLQFTDDQMPEKVMAILNTYNIPSQMIKIEITEREMVADTHRTRAIMMELIAKGIAFELDDFGMDYSNLSVVLELPLETIKLDRSLLLTTAEKEENKSFFCHLVTAISALGCLMISEGVEDKSQYDFIASCGCEYIQGYYFSTPLPLPELGDFLVQSTPHLATKATANS